MRLYKPQKSFHLLAAVFGAVFFLSTVAFAADNSKEETPAYQTAMNDAVTQFIGILENLKKQPLTESQKIQKLNEITQAVRWGPELQFSFITLTEQMVVVAAANQSLIGKDMLNYTDPNGKKPFLEAKSKPGGGFVTMNWPSPGGQFPVPSIMLLRPITFSQWMGIGTIVPEAFSAYGTDILTTIQVVQDPTGNKPFKQTYSP